VLASVLRRGCRPFPDTLAVNRRLEELFGARLALDVSKRGEQHLTHARLDLVNERLLEGAEGTLSAGIALLFSILTDPVIEDGGLRREEFRQEQVNQVRAIQGLQDDKIAYAHQRLLEEMFRGEPYARFEHGAVDAVEALDPRACLRFHERRLARAPLRAYLVGNVTDGEEALVRAALAALPRDAARAEPAPAVVRAPGAPRAIAESAPLEQSKLEIGYRFDPRGLDDRRYYALGLFNTMLGGGATSKLFKEVREARSLAYYARSAIDRLKGALVLAAGVAPKDWEQAAAVMKEQVAAMKAGAFSADELEIARAVVLNSLRGVNDSPHQAIEFASLARTAGRPADPARTAEIVRGLGRADITAVAALPAEDTTFVLGATLPTGSTR
jgi:predicted Zn-dependent peptidase